MSLAKRNFKKGFTLVELLVVISIFSILTGVVLFNQTKFDSTILLTNLAYDTALTIRQAQNYGINIKEFNGSGKFVPYGVHFKKDDPETPYNEGKSFILFADLSYNSEQDSGIGIYNLDNEANLLACEIERGCVNRYNIQRGNYIKDICEAEVSVGVFVCPGDTSRDSLDITFKRPNPDAFLRFDPYLEESTLGVATVILGSSDDSTRKVRIRSNGLIEIVN